MAGRRAWQSLVPIALGVTILAAAGLLAFARVQGQDLRGALTTLDWRYLPLAAGLHVLAHVLWGTRMAILSGPCGIPIGPVAGWRLVTAGVFGGAVTPGRIGGEALKLTLLVRRGASGADASRLLLLDRASDLVFFMCTGVAAFFLLPLLFVAGHEARGYAAAGAGVLILFLVLLVVVLRAPSAGAAMVQGLAAISRLWGRRPEVRAQAAAFLHSVRDGAGDAVRKHPWRVVAALLLTVANWVAEYGVLWVLLRAFGHDVPYVAVFLVGTVLTLVSNIPLTPGGTAVAEFTAYALLAPQTVGLTVLFPLVWRSVTYLYDLVVGGAMASVLLPGALRRRSSVAEER